MLTTSNPDSFKRQVAIDACPYTEEQCAHDQALHEIKRLLLGFNLAFPSQLSRLLTAASKTLQIRFRRALHDDGP